MDIGPGARLNGTGLMPVLEGGAVKAGPLGPPVGAALTAPAFYGASHNCHRTPRQGGPWPPVLFQAPKRWGRHSSGITIAQ